MTIKTISHSTSVAVVIITCMKTGRQSQTHECNCGIFYSLLRLPSFEKFLLFIKRTKLNFNEFDNLWKWNSQINLCEQVIRILGFTVQLKAKGSYIWQLCNWIICVLSSSQTLIYICGSCKSLRLTVLHCLHRKN